MIQSTSWTSSIWAWIHASCIMHFALVLHNPHCSRSPSVCFFFLHSLIFNDTACLIIIAIICVLCLTADKCVKMNNWLEYGSPHSLAAAWTELNSRCEMPDQCRMAVNKRVTALFASVLFKLSGSARLLHLEFLSIKSSCLRKWDGQIDRPLSQADLSNGLIFKALKVPFRTKVTYQCLQTFMCLSLVGNEKNQPFASCARHGFH